MQSSSATTKLEESTLMTTWPAASNCELSQTTSGGETPCSRDLSPSNMMILSCAQWPSKVLLSVPHHKVRARNEPISGELWTTGSQERRGRPVYLTEWPDSHNRTVPIACNACCNALVLYVTQGCAEDVSGVHTHIYIYTQYISTVEGKILHFRVFKALMYRI